ncbi:MAG: regulatory protein RecX [Micrococcales bacterium]
MLSPERQEQRARNVLLYQLSRSAKTAKQCRDILAKREIDSAIAESVINRYIEVGLIDDSAVAGTIVNSRRTYKGLSKTAIKRELAEKGIAAEIIEVAVAPLDSASEQATCTSLAMKRIGRLASLERDVRQRRLMGYLARKGFSSGHIIEAMKVAEAELASQG